MKELYIAPELKLVCFVSAQSLATAEDRRDLNFNDFFGGEAEEVEPATSKNGDYRV